MYLILAFIVFSYSFCIDKVFVACEGNFYQANGSLWTIQDNEVYEFEGNPVGEIVQSLEAYNNLLFVAVNVSSNIQVFNIGDDGLSLVDVIDTQNSGPREMIVYDDYLYFSNWYTSDIKKINLSTMQIEGEILMPGLPEDLVLHNGNLYISIIMEHDWTDGNKVVVVDPLSEVIVNEYNVGMGPGELIVHENEIYIARTYYDEDWNAFYGTSKINQSGEVVIANYGAGTACGGSVHSFNDSVYRAYNGGIAKLDENLNIIHSSRIGDFNIDDVYSIDTNGDQIFFGLTDYASPDEIVVLDSDGNEISQHFVGALPGDFAFWQYCSYSGDANEDGILNIVDIVGIINSILEDNPYLCEIDLNADNVINILDVLVAMQNILNSN